MKDAPLKLINFFGGGGGAQAVNPPKPLQIDLNQMQGQMIGADQAAYNAGDAYMQQFYPQLTQARDNMIKQAYGALTGPLDPSMQNTFVNAANMGSANAFGGGNQSYGLGLGGGGGGGGGTPANVAGGGGTSGSSWGGQGSLARNAAAASVASDEQGYQDYNRSMFENLTSLYAPRSFGMTPEDAANVFTFNNTQFNNYLQQQFAAQTQAFYQSQGQAAAGQGALFGAGASIISAAIPAIITAL